MPAFFLTLLVKSMRIQLFLFLSYREVAHTHWILEETLEAGSPAGHALLWDPSMAARSWKTAIAV